MIPTGLTDGQLARLARLCLARDAELGRLLGKAEREYRAAAIRHADLRAEQATIAGLRALIVAERHRRSQCPCVTPQPDKGEENGKS